MSAQENAEAILMVIKRLAKWILIGFVIIALLVGVIYLWSTLSDWYQVDRHMSKVAVIVKFDKTECADKEYPLLIHIENKSTQTIEHIRVDAKVTKMGYSNKINNYSSFDSDKIFKPQEGFQSCWRVYSTESNETLDGENMTVVLENFHVNFVK